jgi:hypothetical protein
VLAILPRAENKYGFFGGRTWSGIGAHLDIREAMYFIVYYDVQRDVNCKGDEGKKSGDESEE